MDIPNDNIFRISVTNFTVSDSNSDGLECRSERTEADTSVFTNGYLVADGDSPIESGIEPLLMHYGALERGWDTKRVVSDNRRFHYLRRRESRVALRKDITIVNPRRACAARVTVVVLCVCVCVSAALICDSRN